MGAHTYAHTYRCWHVVWLALALRGGFLRLVSPHETGSNTAATLVGETDRLGAGGQNKTSHNTRSLRERGVLLLLHSSTRAHARSGTEYSVMGAAECRWTLPSWPATALHRGAAAPSPPPPGQSDEHRKHRRASCEGFSRWTLPAASSFLPPPPPLSVSPSRPNHCSYTTHR